ncbi:MAG: glycosyltransferase family 4 protein [Pyrinomonadaceae bacterium]
MGTPDPDSLGGPAACEPPFVAELRRLGVSVEEVTYVYGEKLTPTPITRRMKRVLTTAFHLKQKLKSASFELLHLNTSFDARALLRDIVTLTVIGRRSTKIFVKFHGSNAELLGTSHPILRVLVRRLLSRVDGIGVLSTEEKKNFVRAGWDNRKIFVVPNVVERNPVQTNGNFNSRYHLREGSPTLLFIARFIPAKGLLDVIRACGLLREQSVECALLCVGDGPARAAAELETDRLGLRERIKFLGQISEEKTAEFYANCTMLVFPTYHYEGFPMSVFYAAAAGLPIITTRIRATADYLGEPENCFWVEPRNPAMLAEKIAALLGSMETRNRMSEANKELAHQFSAELVTQKYLQVYQDLIARP